MSKISAKMINTNDNYNNEKNGNINKVELNNNYDNLEKKKFEKK